MSLAGEGGDRSTFIRSLVAVVPRKRGAKKAVTSMRVAVFVMEGEVSC